VKLPRRSVLFGLAALLLSAVIAFRALVSASSPFTWDLYVLWLLAPYAVLIAALLVPWGDPDRRARTGCVTALVVLAVSHFVYRDASAASTGGLIFAVFPKYLLPAGPLLWALLYWLGPSLWTWLSAETGKLDD
jgi:hypothetical protein